MLLNSVDILAQFSFVFRKDIQFFFNIGDLALIDSIYILYFISRQL